ncbi:UPF0716 protein FxsA [Azospirillum fermentarium]|uniref:FxsA family protein n=1 Tax=Azospirillum fermentarium TaxID=1233114 RepID=UPI002225E2CA|nr:FxsA family protein [Azospirillum fermentarium]MCW2244555.1 UPF0716 protein FxsA [Azospirillum fermentarium]
MNPLAALLLLPIVEIVGFVMMGDWLGLWPTLGLLALGVVAGSVLIRVQGLSTLRRVQESAQRGEMPMGALFDGFCTVIGGVLLIIPGFFSDVLALLLIIGPVRRTLGRWMFGRMQTAGGVWMAGGRSAGAYEGAGFGDEPRRPTHRPDPGVIDGDFREVDPAPDPAMPRLDESRWRPAPPKRDGDA